MTRPDRTPPAIAGLTLFLGVAMLASGLKFVSPFREWYAAQISGGGLPAFASPLGIAVEGLAGVLFIAPWVLRKPLRPHRRLLWRMASMLVIGSMATATYVHLQPGVPAEVLPLKIKPPLIPLSMLALAVVTLWRVRPGAPGES